MSIRPFVVLPQTLVVALLLGGCLGPDTLPWAAAEETADPEPAQTVDDEGPTFSGDLCSPTAFSEPDRPPRVKVVTAMDVSGSLQFVDQAGQRLVAQSDLQLHLAQNADVHVANVGLGVTAYAHPSASAERAFLWAQDWIEPPFTRRADVGSDLQGGLERVVEKIIRDLEGMSAAERAETTYVVLVITDGGLAPTCCRAADERVGERAGAEGCGGLPIQEGTIYCGSSPEPDLCNDLDFLETARAEWSVDVATSDYDAAPPLRGLEVGEAYNSVDTLVALAAKLRGLSETHGAREVRLSVGHLVSPDLAPDVIDIYSIDDCTAHAELSEVAAAGGGALVTLDTSTAFGLTDVLYACAPDPVE